MTAKVKKTRKKPGPKHSIWPTEKLADLQAKIAAYFMTHGGENDDGSKQPPLTASGLCLALDFNSRQTFLENAQRPDVIGDAIKKATLRVAEWVEGKSFGNNPTGAIFWLKNHGWHDERTVRTPDFKVEGVRIIRESSPDSNQK